MSNYYNLINLIGYQDFYEELCHRLDYPYPNQGISNLCGPAVFFYSILNSNKYIYSYILNSLYYKGFCYFNDLFLYIDVNTKNILIKSIFSNNNNQINLIDFISLASIRESSNSFFSMKKIDDKLSNITFPKDLITWFEKSGSPLIVNKIKIINSSSIKDILDINYFLDNKRYNVISLIDSSLFSDSKMISYPNHWVVFESKITLSNSHSIDKYNNLDEYIKLKVFSWGSTYELFDYKITIKKFLQKWYGYLVFGDFI